MPKPKFNRKRPVSWSYLNSFEYSPEEWYNSYILGNKQPESAEMIFGKKFADSCEARKPLAPVTLLSKMEQEFNVMFGKVPLKGFADTFDDVTFKKVGEFKTGVKKWDQKRVDGHGQITMYALMNYITNKVKPEDCEFFLEWIPTTRKENGDFSVTISFKKPIQVIHFKTKRTMRDIISFGDYINKTLDRMEKYVESRANLCG